jgi:urease accessory protein
LIGMPAAPALKIFAANRAFGRIAFEARANCGVTRRWRVREEGPLRLRCPGSPSPELEAVILNTAGGIVGGDRFELDMTVAADARVIVTSTAAEKIYRSLGPDSALDLHLKVAAGGALAWLPQETILFNGARLTRNVRVDLADAARLIFAEAVIFGRRGMGEEMERGRLLDRWRVRRDGRMLHAEALRLDGAIATRLAQGAVAKGSGAIATVLVVPADETAASAVRKNSFHGEVAASAWKGLMIVRLCARDAAALRKDLIAVLQTVRAEPLPRLLLN